MDVSQRNWKHLIFQPLLAAVYMFVVLLVLTQVAVSDVLWAVGGGSLASSCFLVFGRPSQPSSLPWRVIGGYLVGIGVGLLVRLLAKPLHLFGSDFLADPRLYLLPVMAAIALFLAFFFMILLNVKHPPAAGIALVLVINLQDYMVLTVIFLAAVGLSLLWWLLRPYLCDLQ